MRNAPNPGPESPPAPMDISIILDRSGSMQGAREQTVSAFNAFLADQRTEPGELTLTLVQFDDEYETVYDAVPLVDVPDLTQQRYEPRGCTALLDAIGRTIHRTDARLAGLAAAHAPPRILIAILTDGLENASSEFDERTIARLIADRQRAGWRFVFLAANQDAIATACCYSVRRKDAMSIKGDPDGMASAMFCLSSATKRQRRRPAKLDADFFTDAEREANRPDETDPR